MIFVPVAAERNLKNAVLQLNIQRDNYYFLERFAKMYFKIMKISCYFITLVYAEN